MNINVICLSKKTPEVDWGLILTDLKSVLEEKGLSARFIIGFPEGETQVDRWECFEALEGPYDPVERFLYITDKHPADLHMRLSVNDCDYIDKRKIAEMIDIVSSGAFEYVRLNYTEYHMQVELYSVTAITALRSIRKENDPDRKKISTRKLIDRNSNRLRVKVFDIEFPPVVVPWYPKMYIFFVTSLCNHRCIICPYHANHETRKTWKDYRFILDYLLFKEQLDIILSQYQGKKKPSISLTARGEPFLNKDIFKIIEYIKRNDLKVIINTNMSNIVTDKLERIVDSGVDIISTSMDGGNKQVYERMCPGADFDIFLNNLIRLNELCEKSCNKTFLNVSYALSRNNYQYLEETMNLWAELGLNSVSIKLMEPYEMTNKEQLDYVLSWDDKDIFDSIVEQYNRSKIDKYNISLPEKILKFSSYGYDMPLKLCPLPWESLGINIVSPDLPPEALKGNAVVNGPCRKDSFNYSMGNIMENSIEEIWNNKHLVEWRKKLVERRPPPTCAGCHYFPQIHDSCTIKRC